MKILQRTKKWSLIGLLTGMLIFLGACQIDQEPHTVNAVNSTEVHMLNSLFTPARIVIAKGQTVTWVNDDFTAHTVTSDSGKALNSGVIERGQSYSHTFNQRGIYSYHCRLRNNMHGIVEVR